MLGHEHLVEVPNGCGRPSTSALSPRWEVVIGPVLKLAVDQTLATVLRHGQTLLVHQRFVVLER
mgnify:CR=1 FL=1